MFTEFFGQVIKRHEHLPNMEKLLDVFEIHQANFEKLQTFSNTKLIEQGGQTRRNFTEHENSTLFVEMFVTIDQGLMMEMNL